MAMISGGVHPCLKGGVGFWGSCSIGAFGLGGRQQALAGKCRLAVGLTAEPPSNE